MSYDSGLVPGTGGGNGQPGASAYDLWLAAGNTGTVEDFLASLVGQPGSDGGAGLADRGAFAPGTAYAAGDVVTALGRRWQAKAATSGRFITPAGWLPLSPLPLLAAPSLADSENMRVGARSGGVLSNGTDTGQNSIAPFRVDSPMGTVVFRFPNFATTSTDTQSPDSWDLAASAQVVLPAEGPIIPLTFRGARTTTLRPSQAFVDSDPVYVGAETGAYVNVRSFQSAASGLKWVVPGVTGGSAAKVGKTRGSAGETDLTLTTGDTGYALDGTRGLYGPIAILAHRPASGVKPGILALGDSITSGATWLRRVVVSLGVPYVDFAKISEAGRNVPTVANHRLPCIGGTSRHGICAYGRNDFPANTTFSAFLDYQRTAWRAMRRSGIEVLAVATVPPQTTSDDAWATPGGQTTVALDGVRQEYNDGLRNNTWGEVDAVIDLAAACQDPNNPAIWRTNGSTGAAGYTGDGIHPNANLHDFIAPLVQPDVVNLLSL